MFLSCLRDSEAGVRLLRPRPRLIISVEADSGWRGPGQFAAKTRETRAETGSGWSRILPHFSLWCRTRDTCDVWCVHIPGSPPWWIVLLTSHCKKESTPQLLKCQISQRKKQMELTVCLNLTLFFWLPLLFSEQINWFVRLNRNRRKRMGNSKFPERSSFVDEIVFYNLSLRKETDEGR